MFSKATIDEQEYIFDGIDSKISRFSTLFPETSKQESKIEKRIYRIEKNRVNLSLQLREWKSRLWKVWKKILERNLVQVIEF